MEKDQIERMTREYNMLQEQLQALAIQKEQFSEKTEEYDEALKEIQKATGKIYLAVGGAIIEVDKQYATKGIEEKKEVASMRIGIVKKQYDDLSKKEQTLRAEINSALKELKG
jgi:prefoldin beta subunit